MVRMIATRPLTYNTRRMRAGDEFEMRDNHAPLFIRMNKATLVPEKRQQVAAIQTVEPPVSDDLTALRNQATALGLTIDMRWGVKRLQSAIKRATTETMV